MKRVVALLIAALFVGGLAIAIFDPDSLSGPDAGEQEKAVTECLRRADFKVSSEIPPVARGNQSPEYTVEVRQGGGPVAYIHLFDFPESASAFVDDARMDAEADDERPTIKQRGPAAVDLDPGARSTARIHRCIDEAAKPPK